MGMEISEPGCPLRRWRLKGTGRRNLRFGFSYTVTASYKKSQTWLDEEPRPREFLSFILSLIKLLLYIIIIYCTITVSLQKSDDVAKVGSMGRRKRASRSGSNEWRCHFEIAGTVGTLLGMCVP